MRLRLKTGDVISFGSGTTSFLAVKEIGKKCKEEGLKIIAIPTSEQIQLLCEYLDIKTAKLGEYEIDWGFDGADEVDRNNWLIKGQGAAMYKEKKNILKSPIVYILVDESKLVQYLGEKYPVPVECDIEKINVVMEELKKLGAIECVVRTQKNGKQFLVTENNKYIIDTRFAKITDDLEERINKIDGVLDNGLFINYSNIEVLKA